MIREMKEPTVGQPSCATRDENAKRGRLRNRCEFRSLRMVKCQLLAGILFWTLMLSGYGSSSARAVFTTVINSPPASLENIYSIGSDTQLNLYDGAALPGYVQLGNYWQAVSNVEINLNGGTI